MLEEVSTGIIGHLLQYRLNQMPAVTVTVTVTAALAFPSLLRPGRAAPSPVSEHALNSFRQVPPCHRLGLNALKGRVQYCRRAVRPRRSLHHGLGLKCHAG